MKLKLELLLILVVLLVVWAGIAEWRYTHRRYDDRVLYESSTLTFESPYQVSINWWWDPTANLDRFQTLDQIGVRNSIDDLSAGVTYYWDQSQPAPFAFQMRIQQVLGLRARMDGYRRYGPGGDGTRYLRYATDRIESVLYNGRPALHFRVRTSESEGVWPQEVWVDAHTLVVLKEVFHQYNGSAQIDVFSSPMHWLPSGSLPVDFFTPPHASQSLWDQVQGWARDHISSRL